MGPLRFPLAGTIEIPLGRRLQMKIYLFENPSEPLPEELRSAAVNCGFDVRVVEMPEDHEKIPHLMQRLEPGVVVVPDFWEDLFCVKAAQEILDSAGPFEVVLWGPQPEIDNLMTAFNEGVCGFLSCPFREDDFRRLFIRAARKVERRAEARAKTRRGEILLESLEIHHPMALPGREATLALAMADFFNRRGPLFERDTRVLALVPSAAQSALLRDSLRSIGIGTDDCSSISMAAEMASKNSYSCVISSCVLDDGSVDQLPQALIEAGVKTLPWTIAWTSSLEKALELRKPGSGIDDTVLKSGKDHGIASLVLAVVAAAYNG